MKKLVALVAIGGALVAGLTSPASAADTVTVQCTTFFGTPPIEVVFGTDFSTGVVLPTACTAANSSCAGCIAALTTGTNPFVLQGALAISQAITGYAGPYFILQR
jgi:hypothetical protein